MSDEAAMSRHERPPRRRLRDLRWRLTEQVQADREGAFLHALVASVADPTAPLVRNPSGNPGCSLNAGSGPGGGDE